MLTSHFNLSIIRSYIYTEPAGIEALVSVLGCSSLIALQASNQQANYEEHHLENIYQILAEALGLCFHASI